MENRKLNYLDLFTLRTIHLRLERAQLIVLDILIIY